MGYRPTYDPCMGRFRDRRYIQTASIVNNPAGATAGHIEHVLHVIVPKQNTTCVAHDIFSSMSDLSQVSGIQGGWRKKKNQAIILYADGYSNIVALRLIVSKYLHIGFRRKFSIAMQISSGNIMCYAVKYSMSTATGGSRTFNWLGAANTSSLSLPVSRG